MDESETYEDFHLDALLQYDLGDDGEDDDHTRDETWTKSSPLEPLEPFDDAEFEEIYTQSPIELEKASIQSPRSQVSIDKRVRGAKKLVLSPHRKLVHALSLCRDLRRSLSNLSGEHGKLKRGSSLRTMQFATKLDDSQEPQRGIKHSRSGPVPGMARLLSYRSHASTPGKRGVLRGKSSATNETYPEDRSFNDREWHNSILSVSTFGASKEHDDENSDHRSETSSSVHYLDDDEVSIAKNELSKVNLEASNNTTPPLFIEMVGLSLGDEPYAYNQSLPNICFSEQEIKVDDRCGTRPAIPV
jgi:hypothetical protein